MTLEATHPSLCLLGVVEFVGVGFGLGSSLEVDRDETDAKSSYQTYQAKEEKNVCNVVMNFKCNLIADISIC